MKSIMVEAEFLARVENVWIDGRWSSADVTKRWSTIWPDLEPHMRTLTTRDGKVTHGKSRQGQTSWRTLYNKFVQVGKYQLPSKNVRARVGGIVPEEEV